MGTTGGIKIFSGNANPELAEEICRQLGCDMGRAFTERFSDGEFNFQIDENVRGGDVFIVQPTCPPTDAHLMELLVMLDAFPSIIGRTHHGGAFRITVTRARTRKIGRACRSRQSWWRT